MRKMLKKLGIVIPSAVLTLLMAVGFSTPAFAYVEPEVKEEPAQVIEEEEPTEEEKIPFTIAGNGEVEDNITDDSSKEFFTVKTKGGNTFFLVIDRARNSENVYKTQYLSKTKNTLKELMIRTSLNSVLYYINCVLLIIPDNETKIHIFRM